MGLSEKQLKKMLPEEEAEESTQNAAGPEDDEDEETGDDDDEKTVIENAETDDEDEEKPGKTKTPPKGKSGKGKKKPTKNSRQTEEAEAEAEDQDDDEESQIVENRKATKPTRLNTDDYLATLPKDVRRVVANALKTEEREKNRLIGLITANTANTFKKQFLLTKSVTELGALARLAQSGVQSESNFTMAGGDVVENEAADEKGLDLPNWDFSGNGGGSGNSGNGGNGGGRKARQQEEEAEVEA
jgi:hypothetical protein